MSHIFWLTAASFLEVPSNCFKREGVKDCINSYLVNNNNMVSRSPFGSLSFHLFGFCWKSSLSWYFSSCTLYFEFAHLWSESSNKVNQFMHMHRLVPPLLVILTLCASSFLPFFLHNLSCSCRISRTWIYVKILFLLSVSGQSVNGRIAMEEQHNLRVSETSSKVS